MVMTATLYSCGQPQYVQGKRTYDAVCADCHMEDGTGVADLYPDLLHIPDEYSLIDMSCIIRHGLNNDSSLIKMPGLPYLKAVDITNIINYVMNDLNHSAREYRLNEVEDALTKCPIE